MVLWRSLVRSDQPPAVWCQEVGILLLNDYLCSCKSKVSLQLPGWGEEQQQGRPAELSSWLWFCPPAFKAAVLIQQWYRRHVARLEMRRRCTWRIFQSIEYACEQDQIKLHNFFSYLMDHFTPSSSKERDFISRMFISGESIKEAELEKYCDYESIEVPDSYPGPHLSFPLLPDHATALLEAFKQKQQLHARYVLNLLHETRKHLKQLPNISHVSTCYSEEVTVCGDLHGQLDDLFLIFYKNGLPSPSKSYVFNGDFVDRGKQSLEILIVLFTFLLIYPKEVHLNRGNHEDHMVNLRYGFTKEVMQKYKVHGKKILKMIQNVFCWLPLATLIDQKVLIIHGGISDTTDLDMLETIQRHKFISVLRGKKRKESNRNAEVQETNGESKAEAEPAGKEAAPGLCPQPRAAQAPSMANRQEFSRWVRQTVQEQIERCRRLVDVSESESEELTYSSSVSLADLDGPCWTRQEEWKQILDILWSDPMPQEGCRVNTVRGGGCYFGPDVTGKILEKHNLQFLIRSHECKQEGYEFCHGRKNQQGRRVSLSGPAGEALCSHLSPHQCLQGLRQGQHRKDQPEQLGHSSGVSAAPGAALAHAEAAAGAQHGRGHAGVQVLAG
ncbi:serine/threonine-protein phosphatase with EF-hands 2 isoform X4 [Melanerpes formicivorus]|uniref:serine/threonine-protein phosphatase with EF-hands 2 isoform X4 n=1 Tax=Melanerpes formicivorus TaxID=211600 RepID=UPI00358FD17C